MLFDQFIDNRDHTDIDEILKLLADLSVKYCQLRTELSTTAQMFKKVETINMKVGELQTIKAKHQLEVFESKRSAMRKGLKRCLIFIKDTTPQWFQSIEDPVRLQSKCEKMARRSFFGHNVVNTVNVFNFNLDAAKKEDN